MSRAPQCSVVIPTYNRADLLARTLASLTRQDLGTGNFEVIVVDDGSTDHTEATVRSFYDSLILRYCTRQHDGFGAAAARNVGLLHSASDVCVFLDSGVLAHSHCIGAHVASHFGTSALALIGYVYCFNQNNEEALQIREFLDRREVDEAVQELAATSRWLDDRELFYRQYHDSLADCPAPWLVFWTCNASAPTRLLQDAGGFDEAFRTWGAEDVDLAYRLFRDGARFVLNRAAAAIHYPHPKDFDANKASAVSNRQYFADKYGTPTVRVLVDNPNRNLREISKILESRGLAGKL
jgi:glycosyltransferase involved in cell wall biosynthesis